MRPAGGMAIAAMLALPMTARAGAWPQAPGATQIIASYESGTADAAFANGETVPISGWQQDTLSVYAEHGVSKHFTVTGKLNARTYEIGQTRLSGLSSVEVGGRWTLRRTSTVVLAVGGSLEGLGHGRRNDFDALEGRQGTDIELRAYSGKAFKLDGADAYLDVQVARRWRQYNANQWRLDATLGIKPTPNWTMMAQVFAGQTDKHGAGQTGGGKASWAHAQVSVVRHFGPNQDLSLQIGVRRTFAGRNVPQVDALIVGLWKSF